VGLNFSRIFEDITRKETGLSKLYPSQRGKKEERRAKVARHTDRNSGGGKEVVDPNKTTANKRCVSSFMPSTTLIKYYRKCVQNRKICIMS
jgi:hypothetical protein